MTLTPSVSVAASTKTNLLSQNIRTKRAGIRPFTGTGKGSKSDQTSTLGSTWPLSLLSRGRGLQSVRS